MRIIERSTADRWFVAVLSGLTLVQLLLLATTPYDLAPDEAHYWEWSRALDWSYYSKGPIVAYLIAGSTAILGDTAFAVRFPAVICFLLFSIIYYVFVRRHYPPWIAFGSFVAMRSMLIFAQMGFVMTTDPPAALFWLAALIAVYCAVAEELRGCWILFGILAGLGVLAKLTVAALIPSMILLLLLTPPHRNHLISRRFWTGMLAFGLTISPLLIWNLEHGWVNVAHNATHVVGTGELIRFKYLPQLIGGQLGLVGPLMLVGFIIAMTRGIALWRAGDAPSGIFLFSSLPLVVLVVAVSLTKKVYDNWPLPAWIGALLLATHLVSQKQLTEKVRSYIVPAIVLSGVITLAAHLPFAGFTFGLPAFGITGRILPTKKLVGWRELGRAVDHAIATTGLTSAFVISEDYEVASEIAFYSKLHGRVYCAVLDSRRMNQYDVWGGWHEQTGRDALIVLKRAELIEKLRPHFRQIENISARPYLTVAFAGEELRSFHFFIGRTYDGTPPDVPMRR